MTDLRYYSNNAVSTELAAGATSSDMTITVASTTGFPASYPFTIAVDSGGASEELLSVTAVAGTTLTVERGFDNTTAVAHSAGAVVEHVHSAVDFREAREHEAATSDVHGVTGAVVGTTDTQTLTNKSIELANNAVTFAAKPGKVMATDASGNVWASDRDLPASTIVDESTAQALTNKDLASSTNTFPWVIQQGIDAGNSVGGPATLFTGSVTFPTAFSAAPAVIITGATANDINFTANSITTTGFSWRAKWVDGATHSSSGSFSWIAIGS